MDIFLNYLEVICLEPGRADSSSILDLIGGFVNPRLWPSWVQQRWQGWNLACPPIAVPVAGKVGSGF